MILVVAGAVAALLGRSIAPNLNEPLPPGFAAIWQYLAWVQLLGSCAAVPGMAAMIAIRLRRPRPSRLRLGFQPGFVACVAVVGSLAPGLAWYVGIRHRPGFQRPGSFDQVWYCVTEWTGTTVLGAWIALILARRWRPEPSWIDRAGRAQLPRVVSTTREDFGWAAATAVARWQFTPPTKDGKPVDVKARVPVSYTPPANAPQS